MRFGVTGGAGFIGTNLVRLLLEKGHQVVVLDDFSTGLRSNLKDLNVEILEASLTDSSAVEKFASDVEFVFHLGARGSVPRSIENPRATFDVNTLGTLNVLEAARVRRLPVVFSSSSSVYGDNTLLPKTEDQRLSPITPYAASKSSAEHFAYAYAKSYNMQVWTVRFFNVFGPYQRPEHVYAAVIPKWIWSALRNEELIVFGDGTTTRDFTYVDSVTSALYSFIDSKNSRLLPVNLAFGKPISLNSVITELRKYFPELRVRFSESRIGDIQASENDPRVLNQVFPRLKNEGFLQGLAKTVSWLRERFELDDGKYETSS